MVPWLASNHTTLHGTELIKRISEMIGMIVTKYLQLKDIHYLINDIDSLSAGKHILSTNHIKTIGS